MTTKSHQAASSTQTQGSTAGPVNAPRGLLQAEPSANISIITEKPGDCQAQSPDVADNMFEVSAVKVSGCSSNMEKKPRCHFPSRSQPQVAAFSLTDTSFFLSPQPRPDTINRAFHSNLATLSRPRLLRESLRVRGT